MRKKISLGFLVVLGLFVGLWFVCAIYAFPDKRPEWISAFAAVISAAGVFLVRAQLASTKNIAQLQFEDALEKEYRELIKKIPITALLDSDLDELEYRKSFDEFFCYFDLSNKQISLRKQSRIGDETWENWCSGIRFNLSLPAFEKAWSEVKTRTNEHANEFFSELRRLEDNKFLSNPKHWD